MSWKQIVSIIIFGIVTNGCSNADASSADRLMVLDNSNWSADLKSEAYDLGDQAKYTCQNPLNIKVSENREHLNFQFDGDTWDAKILEVSLPPHLFIQVLVEYEPEERLGPRGKPLRWVLIMPEENTFLWHAKFQENDNLIGKTHDRVRCSLPST